MFNLDALGVFRRGRDGRSAERFSMLRYHGLWGPGVRLLQNLRFRNKALLLVVCLVLPIGMLAFEAWRGSRAGSEQIQRSAAGLQEYRAVLAEQQAIGSLYEALDSKDPASALKQEQQAADAMARQLSGTALDGDVGQAMSGFVHARQSVLQRLREHAGPAALGQAERDEALALLERQANGLRTRVMHAKGAALRDDPRLWSLAYGGLDRLPFLQMELQQALRLQVRLAAAASASDAVSLLERVATAQQWLDLTRNGLQPATALGVLDTTQTQAQLSVMERFLVQLRLRARATLLVEGAGQAGLPTPDALARYGSEAVQAARALNASVVEVTARELSRRDLSEHSAQRATLGVTAAGLGLMVYFLVCLNKVVGGGLRELASRVDALARGDLSEKPLARGSDEVGMAMTSLGESVRRMASLFEAVTQGVAAVSHASREVATGNAGLSGRTGDIRRSIGDAGERARSSMEAMHRAGDEVERIADHMREVRADAYRSRKAMTELQALMRNLQGKSREIGRVVQLVESVAHQTRLLSLNASVEAARAGAAGKGFGVVAQEVRELARRSESAAQKIAEIVQASVSEIEAGGLLTERVGDSVRLTDERVGEVSSIMGDIVRLTHAGREHSEELVGITRSVEDSAGGNARMVEQLAQASADLREQGDNLRRSMQHFVFG